MLMALMAKDALVSFDVAISFGVEINSAKPITM